MSKRSQEKRRARSKEKKLAKRREVGTSPLARLAGTAEEACECWSTYAEEGSGIRSLSVFRPVRGGGHVAAFFLIDYDCLGLKDAFVRLNVDILEMREVLRARSESEGIRLVRIKVEEAREMLAGAVRWTLAHPFFRLPNDAARCMKIVGGVSAVETADISEFGTEDGGLFYIGRERDLERRLMGMTIDEFLEQPDVACEFTDELYDAFDREAGLNPEDREKAEEVQEMLAGVQAELKGKMLEAIRRWCLAHQQAPHPDLDKAVDLMLAASTEGMLADKDELDEEDLEPHASEAETQAALEAEKTLLSLETQEEREQIAGAQQQLGGFMNSFGSMQEMMASLGWDETKE